MSMPSNQNPKSDRPITSDESLLAAHEKQVGKQPDERGHYGLLPLALLFVFSGLIFYAGSYLNRYQGGFDRGIYNENAHPHTGEVVVAAIDPLVLGKKQYQQVCQACHQESGLGVPGAFPPLVGADWVTGSEERLVRILLNGLGGPIKVKGVDYNGAMPAIGKGGYNLNDEKIAAVLTYVRHEWGNAAAPISTQRVTEIRIKAGDRATPWTQEELLKLP